MNNSLIVLLGPTGVGKTDIAIDIAKILGTDIISADSRQFFSEMSIGTAMPTASQLKEVKHHFTGFLSLTDYYSASLFERDVLYKLTELFKHNNQVIMTGGSAMYIDAVCNGIDDIPDVDPLIREKYINLFKTEGVEGLRLALKILDPVHYDQVDLKNPKRIMRALEICDSTGVPYSSFLTRTRQKRDFTIIKAGITRPRRELYDRIDRRVDEMVEAGLEEEARSLYRYRHLNSLNTVGYREFFRYFDSEISRSEAISLIKRNTRRFAKRQITWWNRDNEISWFNASDTGSLVSWIKEKIR